jgi:hypothetical protein
MGDHISPQSGGMNGGIIQDDNLSYHRIELAFNHFAIKQKNPTAEEETE